MAFIGLTGERSINRLFNYTRVRRAGIEDLNVAKVNVGYNSFLAPSTF